MRMTAYLVVATLLAAAAPSPAQATTTTARITVHADRPTVRLGRHLYGLFFEDINFAADGGLYAELVQNRSFEYYPVEGWNPLSESYHPLAAWEKVEQGGARCTLNVTRGIGLNRNNPHYLVIRVTEPGAGAGVANTGYEGMRLNAGARYRLSVYVRRRGREAQPLTAALADADGALSETVTLADPGQDWQRAEALLTARRSTDSGRLILTTTGRGTLCLDMVSLFPEATYGRRPNGLRADLVEALKALRPSFLRFPGGCIAHGQGLLNAYRWKDTVGDVAERRGNWNRWGYHQTYGLGFFEYFQLCEDLGATPLPVLPVGVSCGFTPPYQCVPVSELGPWIDDVIDLVEFANGPVDSEWGALRARMGHAAPFGLEYLCLGNEEHDTPEFRERFPHFVRALRAAHPEIKIVGTSGLGTGIPLFDLMREQRVYSSDEHYYEAPEWFLRHQNRFDDVDRNGPKVFAGEYASRGNRLVNAVAEAAYLTGIERNADVVDMACYAPLFAHLRHTQWRAANLIWFDERQVIRTPNYYVQQLFSRNRGDVVLAAEVEQTAPTSTETWPGQLGIGTWATAIEVERAEIDGRALDLKAWQARGGDFRQQGGRLVQRDLAAQPALCLAPPSLDGAEHTLRLRARVTGGREGFLLVFGYQDPNNLLWWNVGGWNNSQHGIEQIADRRKSLLAQTPGRVEPGTWHDLEVVVGPGRIRCTLDGHLVHDYRPWTPGISVSATRDETGGELLVKLVNPTGNAVDARLDFAGVPALAATAQVTTLTGEPDAANTAEAPDRVTPQTRTIPADTQLELRLPACSVQVLRVGTR